MFNWHFKDSLPPCKKIYFICFNENPLIMMKGGLSFSGYLNFCADIFAMLKNPLIRKIRLISKFMISQPG